MAAFEINQKGFREGLEKGKQIVLDFLQELSIKIDTVNRNVFSKRDSNKLL